MAEAKNQIDHVKQHRMVGGVVNAIRKLTHQHEKVKPWSYNEPDSSPDLWHKCGYKIALNGRKQSPINIDTGKCKILKEDSNEKSLQVLQFGTSEKTELVNTVHTVKAIWNNSTPHIKLDGQDYKLEQFHFHSPSEHTIDGEFFDVELHLVHRSLEDPGSLTVIGIMFNRGDECSEFFAQFVDEIPSSCDCKVENKPLSLAGLKIDSPYWRYEGSLTTPPCTECVNWVVLKDVHTISPEQLESYSNIFCGDTNRPVQPLHGRKVTLYEV